MKERFASELQVDVPMHGGEPVRGDFSFASRVWRLWGEDDLEAFITHCEEKYGPHILGYHVCAGDAGEWAYRWKQVLSDYGPAQSRAFRE